MKLFGTKRRKEQCSLWYYINLGFVICAGCLAFLRQQNAGYKELGVCLRKCDKGLRFLVRKSLAKHRTGGPRREMEDNIKV
jgi:hypothetical protein